MCVTIPLVIVHMDVNHIGMEQGVTVRKQYFKYDRIVYYFSKTKFLLYM